MRKRIFVVVGFLVGLCLLTTLAFATLVVSTSDPTVGIESANVEECGAAVVSIMIENVSNLGYARVNLTFDESVVSVTAISDSDFDSTPNIYTKGPGWALLEGAQSEKGLEGTVRLCDVKLDAIGERGDMSLLNLIDVALDDMQMKPITVYEINYGYANITIAGPPFGAIPDAEIEIWILNNGVWTKDPITMYCGDSTPLLIRTAEYQGISMVETSRRGRRVDTEYLGWYARGNYRYSFIADRFGTHKIVANGTITGSSNVLSVNVIVSYSSGLPPSTTVRIGNAVAGGGENAVVSIMIENVNDLGYAGVNLSFNESVVNVTAISNSDFVFPPNNYIRGPGWVFLEGGQSEKELKGPVRLCNVKLYSVGECGDMSPLNLTDVALDDMRMKTITVGKIICGSFATI
uniref:Cohesin domain-containing protein n=1 Tax=Candidatus Methanophaga sp. ANME-1 ERB7 TaxID=2759913 RepID=A0A7G9Z7Z0_9EURY|nr:hypothetical protein JCABFCCD_00015 [Methanosarcinales archaeon ANME-1 ERB7]